MNFKPMLSADASDVDLNKLNYPLLVSPKLDGIRCIIWEGVAYSRNAKPIRNHYVQNWARNLHNLDGELIVGSPTDPHCLSNTQSGVMSYEGEPDFGYHLFDCPDRAYPDSFLDSLRHAADNHSNNDRVVVVPHWEVDNSAVLLSLEEQYLMQGYEGVMLRHPTLPYKYGRSTLKEGGLRKLKRFQDGEAVVIRLEEGHVNGNVAVRDELGRTKRSTHREGLVPSGMVGTIIAVDKKWGELRIAPGTMNHQARAQYWQSFAHGALPPLNGSDTLVGKTIHWRSFGYGVKDKPRFPRFYGVREDV